MFLFLLLITALAIAGVAAFFSIYGLAHIYSAAFISVVVMASVLEAGKLVSVSFLYRYWHKINWWLKSFFLFLAIPGLMLITSAGVFGYLSNAYQQDSIDLREVEVQIELLETEQQELTEREQQIDEDIARVAANYITKRMELIEQYRPEKEYLSQRRIEIRQEIFELSSRQLEVEAHTGPIIYIAKAFGKDVDTAILWMTILIIFVFDPLAVALTLGYNIAVGKRYTADDESNGGDDPGPTPEKREPITPPTVIVDEPVSSVSNTSAQTNNEHDSEITDEFVTLDELWPDADPVHEVNQNSEAPAVPTSEVEQIKASDTLDESNLNEVEPSPPPPSDRKSSNVPTRSMLDGIRVDDHFREPEPTISTNEQLNKRLHGLNFDS